MWGALEYKIFAMQKKQKIQRPQGGEGFGMLRQAGEGMGRL